MLWPAFSWPSLEGIWRLSSSSSFCSEGETSWQWVTIFPLHSSSLPCSPLSTLVWTLTLTRAIIASPIFFTVNLYFVTLWTLALHGFIRQPFFPSIIPMFVHIGLCITTARTYGQLCKHMGTSPHSYIHHIPQLPQSPPQSPTPPSHTHTASRPVRLRQRISALTVWSRLRFTAKLLTYTWEWTRRPPTCPRGFGFSLSV